MVYRLCRACTRYLSLKYCHALLIIFRLRSSVCLVVHVVGLDIWVESFALSYISLRAGFSTRVERFWLDEGYGFCRACTHYLACQRGSVASTSRYSSFCKLLSTRYKSVANLVIESRHQAQYLLWSLLQLMYLFFLFCLMSSFT